MSAIDAIAGFVRRRPGVVAVCVLCLILLTPFAGVVVEPTAGVLGNPSCDGPSQFYYFHDYAARCWLDGEVPLWNPCVMLGVPFFGEGQASIFHPLSALFLIFPAGVAMNVMLLLSLLLGGIAFYGYLRAIELGRPASVLGAVAWSFSSVTIARIYAGHANIVLGLPAWPFMLWCWHRYLHERRRRYLVFLALGFASLILAGYPQATYIFSIFFVLYAVLHRAGRRHGLPSTVGAGDLATLGAFLALGVAVAAVQLFPSFDFARRSFRSESSYEFCTFFSLPPESFVTLLCPEFFGRAPMTGDGQFWGRAFFWESWLYVGILPLLAAVTGFIAAPSRLRLALGIPALLFLVVGLGRHTPLYPLLYSYVPLYDVFRSPAKHCMVTVLCLAVFAAIGFHAWLSGSMNVRAYRWTVGLGLGALAVCVGLMVFARTADVPDSAWGRFMAWVHERKEIHLPDIDAAFPASAARFASQQLWRAMALIGASLAVLIGLRRWSPGPRRVVSVVLFAVVLLADFFTFIPHFTDRYDEARTRCSDAFLEALPTTPYPVRCFDGAAYPNAAMHYGFSSIGGYMGNTVRRFNRFLNETQGFDPSHSQASATIRGIPPLYLRMLAIDAMHLPVSAAPADLPSTPTDPGWTMVDCRGRCPRAFIAPSPRACTPKYALPYILLPETDPRASPGIETDEPLPPSAPLEAGEGVEIVAFGVNRVELAVTAARPRVVVLCEMYDEDWTATVNGGPAAVYPANYLFRAVIVPAGSSRVVFAYRPGSFVAGAIVSGIAVLAIAGLAIRGGHRSHRASRCA